MKSNPFGQNTGKQICLFFIFRDKNDCERLPCMNSFKLNEIWKFDNIPENLNWQIGKIQKDYIYTFKCSFLLNWGFPVIELKQKEILLGWLRIQKMFKLICIIFKPNSFDRAQCFAVWCWVVFSWCQCFFVKWMFVEANVMWLSLHIFNNISTTLPTVTENRKMWIWELMIVKVYESEK